MSKVSNIPFSFVTILLLLALVAKFVAVAIFWFLPMEGVEPRKNYSFVPNYIHVDFARIMGLVNKKKISSEVVSSTSQRYTINISSMILKGLYGNSKKGFAMVAKKANPNKLSIVAVGQKYEGYELKSIESDGVIFVKDKKEYSLKLQKPKNTQVEFHHKKQSVDDTGQQPTHFVVQTRDIKHFMNHPAQIWKNISIKEFREDGVIKGYKVTWVKKGGYADRVIGIKKGDIIIKVNNKRLRSNADAINIYNLVSKKMETGIDMMITVLRNGQEKELTYEIHP